MNLKIFLTFFYVFNFCSAEEITQEKFNALQAKFDKLNEKFETLKNEFLYKVNKNF